MLITIFLLWLTAYRDVTGGSYAIWPYRPIRETVNAWWMAIDHCTIDYI